MTLTPTGTPPASRAIAPARGGWAGTTGRVRAAATTEPGRLRLIGVLLAVLVVAFGAVTAWQVTERADAAEDVATRTQPLSADAANIYRYLADADTTASTGFLWGGKEPAQVAKRYNDDLAAAGKLVVQASADSSASPQAQAEISVINSRLPDYTARVANAQSYNERGLPLGSAYLRYANQEMTTVLLPAAQRLYKVEEARLGDDYGSSKSVPWAAWALGLVTLIALGYAQRRMFLRTNRVVNRGLAGASAATVVVLLWLVVGHTLARSELEESVTHGANSLSVLNAARIDSLQARGDENLTLVALGGDATFESTYQTQMTALAGPKGGPGGGLLADAARQTDDSEGSAPLAAASRAVGQWRDLHATEISQADKGDYDTAVHQVVAQRGSTDAAFNTVDENLNKAIEHETGELRASVSGARGALTALPEGAALLCLLGAAAGLLGIGRRLSEYR